MGVTKHGKRYWRSLTGHDITHSAMLCSQSGLRWRVLLAPLRGYAYRKVWTTSYGAWYLAKTGKAWGDADSSLWLDVSTVKKL